MSSDGKDNLRVTKTITFTSEEDDPLPRAAEASHRISVEDKRNDVIDESNDGGDMESLLPGNTITEKGCNSSRVMTTLVMNSSPPSLNPSVVLMNGDTSCLDIDTGDDDDDDDDDDTEDNNTNNILQNKFCCGLIRSHSVGNMNILFPEYFYSDGWAWGVIGPHFFGPVCVWLILLGATHGCIKGINRNGLGIYSVFISYIFLGLSTYRLTDVSYRDPGICLDREIPGHETPERARQYRFCDRCKVWQPPLCVHCPECNVCIKGYDHHCVWMGTCIGSRNYRQFVLFNMMWLYYVGYAFFWILTIGPFISSRH